MDLSTLRRNYQSKSLLKSDVSANPMQQFVAWMEEAIQAELPEPNAMILATCGVDNQPAARVVLLKKVLENGFVFYTNYESAKANEMLENSKVALTFNWLELARQIRIQGEAAKVGSQMSEEYFQSRPRDSQVSAWASPQSQEVDNRTSLQSLWRDTHQKFEGKDVLPLPPNWGGYQVIPGSIEFWQGRPDRLHDRVKYSIGADSDWRIQRLAP